MTPRLALCHLAIGKDPAAVREYVTAHRYDGVEWGLDGQRLAVARGRRSYILDGFRSVGVPCSLHAPYTDLEIGHRDAEYAAAALRILREYVDAAAEVGARHLNLHVGSHALESDERSWENLVRNLTALMDYAARRGTMVTVENLRRGLASDPEAFVALLRATGAPVTFDLGHAHSSAWVQEGRGSVVDFLRSIPTRIVAGHLYLTETGDAHVPPAEVGDVADTLDGLLSAGCDWWVLELHTRETLEQTRGVVDQYLASRPDRMPGGR
jgi:sugar phosphate isomerase/epimerase